MTVCDFCQASIFSNVHWLPRNARHHHEQCSAWRDSVRTACTICTLLLEHLKAAVTALEAKRDGRENQSSNVQLSSELPTPIESDKQRDERIRTTTVEEVLIDWLARYESAIQAQLPIYRVSFMDGGGRNLWLLTFEPHSESALKGQLKKQSFNVYGVEYDDAQKQEVNPEPNTNSQTTLNQIKHWIASCKTHTHCSFLHQETAKDAYVPLRLLDVGSKDDPKPKLRLVQTNADTPAKYHPYVTLSYKWGYDPNCVLDDSTLAGYLNEIPVWKLPQTFLDAVALSRRLGVRYLWIDALCLLQRNRDEWLAESPKMQRVYAGAFLSLAATSGDNCDQGLFRARNPAGVGPSVVRVAWAYQRVTCRVVRADFWRGELLAEPLYVRGWVLQERMLAPRILHFHRRQVLWQCPSLTASERMPAGLSVMVDDERKDELRWRQLFHRAAKVYSAAQTADLHEIWRFVVQSYTSCNLTKSGDKLMAVAGVAKQMKPAFQERYVAGLWEHQLAEQLHWRVIDFRPKVGDEAYRAPSWTWASVDGVVTVPPRMKVRAEYVMNIPANGVHLMHEKMDEEEGTLFFGALTVEAELFPMTFATESLSAREWRWVSSTSNKAPEAFCQLSLDAPFESALFSSAENLEDDAVYTPPGKGVGVHSVQCTAAMLRYQRDWGVAAGTYSGFALALRRGSAGHTKVFSRMGLVEFRGFDKDVWKQLPRKMKPRKEGEVAPSDARAADKHIITIL